MRLTAAFLVLMLGLNIAVDASAADPWVQLHRTVDRVDMIVGAQKLTLQHDAGAWRLTTSVREADHWRPMFDAGAPLLGGDSFGLQVQHIDRAEQRGDHAVIVAGGSHQSPDYDYTLRIESEPGASMIHLRLTLTLKKMLILRGLEPRWMIFARRDGAGSGAGDDVAINQGPGNIYHGSPDHQWGNSFPAAYLWHDGCEAAVFVDVGVMPWMSPRNLFRFHNVRVQSVKVGDCVGFGLNVVKRNFHQLGPGEVAFDMHLFAAAQPHRPTPSQALHRLIEICQPLHPSQDSPPPNRLDPGHDRWQDFAVGVLHDLMLRGVTWTDIDLPVDRAWHDLPPFNDHTIAQVRISPDYAIDSACDAEFNRTDITRHYDFTTCNAYLAAALAFGRAMHDRGVLSFMSPKVRELPMFYDPVAHLWRFSMWHTSGPGEREMSWQNLTFALEADRVHRLTPPSQFTPAVGGQFVLSLTGLRELAKVNNDLLPQWFDPATKRALIQADVPELGVVYEPWQIGTYAWLMCEGYRISGDRGYLDTAGRAIDHVLGGAMNYRVKNTRYDVTYRDPTQFPITEIFGNAWGAAACARLAKLTGDTHFRDRADQFLDSLMRMTYWYESSTTDDLRDRAIHNVGLFRNQGGAFTGSPWENTEATLAMAAYLRYADGPPPPLVLKLLNLQRINARWFFPPVFPHGVGPCAKMMNSPASYLPIEDAYTLENGGSNGVMGRAIYMSAMPMWYELLFEQFAQTDNPRVLAVSLDVPTDFNAALAGRRRRLIIYNPTPQSQHVTLRLPGLPDGAYRLTVGGSPPVAMTSADLAAGRSFDLDPQQSLRITAEAIHPAAAVDIDSAIRDELVRKYAQAVAASSPEVRKHIRDALEKSLQLYRNGQPVAAEAVLRQLKKE